MTCRPRTAIFLSLLLCTAIQAGVVPPPTVGLQARYTDGSHTIECIAPSPDFVLKEGESIHPQLGPAFKAEWTGFLQITKKAKYTFTLDGAPDANISLDGHSATGQPIELDAADHAISIKF